MKYIKFNILIYLYFTIIYCVKLINYEKNHDNFFNNNKKLKRSIPYQNNQKNFYNNVANNLKKTSSVNNFNIEQNYRKKRMIASCFYGKWTFPIPYYVDANVNQKMVDLALLIIEKKTCVRFTKHKTMTPGLTGLRYYYGSSCKSRVGKPYENVWQNVSIGKNCDTIETIQHETMHSLGFFHVHSRIDRDQYIYFRKKNIEKRFLSNLEKVCFLDSKTLGVPFDFSSVMMYDSAAYSKNGKNTIYPRDKNYVKTVSASTKVTFTDVKLINLLYCQNICKEKIKCMNGGYQNPNNCSFCICVKGFTGRWCQFLPSSTRECGESVLIAKNKIASLKSKGEKKCIYHIFCEKKKLLAIFIVKSIFFLRDYYKCFRNNSLEIKYWKDKTPSGALFCGLDKNILIISESNHAMISYRSISTQNSFHIFFKSVPTIYNQLNLKIEFKEEVEKYKRLKASRGTSTSDDSDNIYY
uniref:Metalloendopeptidase n=1 Tax=Strongyloides stercoralis TaxID=6248 RepID=A0A0K0EBK6_STRER